MKSFFEKLTGAVNIEDEENSFDDILNDDHHQKENDNESAKETTDWMEEKNEDVELTVDVYQTPDNIIVKTMVAGVNPDDLDISITRDMITISGSREEKHIISEDDYFSKELYWGSFSRSITLPEEVDIDGAEAIEKHGLLTLKLPKVNKERKTRLKVKPKH